MYKVQPHLKTLSKSAVRTSKASAVPTIPFGIEIAAQMIYHAIHDPSCKEVQQALESVGLLDHQHRTLDLVAFHRELIHELPMKQMTSRGGAKEAASKGGVMSMKRCILAGLLVLMLTIASYVISIRSEMSMFQSRCSNILSLFDAKKETVASTFFNELYKFGHMVLNKEQITYCKNMQDKYNNIGIALANDLNKAMNSFKGRLTVSITIVTAVISILSGGIKVLICMAAGWLGHIDKVCNEHCTTGKKRSSKKKSEEAEEEEEEEEEE